MKKGAVIVLLGMFLLNFVFVCGQEWVGTDSEFVNSVEEEVLIDGHNSDLENGDSDYLFWILVIVVIVLLFIYFRNINKAKRNVKIKRKSK